MAGERARRDGAEGTTASARRATGRADGDAALSGLATLVARGFGSTAEATRALLETIATQLGLRTSFLTEITPASGTNRVLAAYNAPGGSGVSAGRDLPLGDTF